MNPQEAPSNPVCTYLLDEGFIILKAPHFDHFPQMSHSSGTALTKRPVFPSLTTEAIWKKTAVTLLHAFHNP